MDRWTGRVALVTGASAGIGDAIARTLAQKGMKVVACARRLDRLETLADEIAKDGNVSGQVFPYKCDTSDMGNIADMFQWIEGKAELGRVDVTICNAGVAVQKNLADLSPDDMRKMMDINVVSTSYITQLTFNLMLKKGIKDGHIIYISSTCAHHQVDTTNMTFYGATKQALKSILESWRREIRAKGENNIRIGAVSPGFVATEAIEASTGSADLAKMIYAATPHIESQDVANAVVQLLTAKPHVQIHDVIVRHVNEK